MLRQVAKQAVHPREVCAVDQVSPLLLSRHQASMRQLFQVERQRIAGKFELVGHDARHEARRSCHHQRAEDAQALGMGKCRKRGYDVFFDHHGYLDMLEPLMSPKDAGASADAQAKCQRRQ